MMGNSGLNYILFLQRFPVKEKQIAILVMPLKVIIGVKQK